MLKLDQSDPLIWVSAKVCGLAKSKLSFFFGIQKFDAWLNYIGFRAGARIFVNKKKNHHAYTLVYTPSHPRTARCTPSRTPIRHAVRPLEPPYGTLYTPVRHAVHPLTPPYGTLYTPSHPRTAHCTPFCTPVQHAVHPVTPQYGTLYALSHPVRHTVHPVTPPYGTLYTLSHPRTACCTPPRTPIRHAVHPHTARCTPIAHLYSMLYAPSNPRTACCTPITPPDGTLYTVTPCQQKFYFQISKSVSKPKLGMKLNGTNQLLSITNQMELIAHVG